MSVNRGSQSGCLKEEQRRRAGAAEEQARQLAIYLRSLGIDPDNLPAPGAVID